MVFFSGMNERGLTVTLNATKSIMPQDVGTPISLLAREILQYASTVEEAYKIANQRQIAVCESFMIGSAIDSIAVMIEKTPTQTELYNQPDKSFLVGTNHFQGEAFAENELNISNIAESDSDYRLQRLVELVDRDSAINASVSVDILRNRLGLEDKEIGIGNDKAINRFRTHHSVVFAPMQQQFWVSTSPWQMGAFVGYKFNKVFSDTLDILAEPMLYDTNFHHCQRSISRCKGISKTHDFQLLKKGNRNSNDG